MPHRDQCTVSQARSAVSVMTLTVVILSTPSALISGKLTVAHLTDAQAEVVVHAVVVPGGVARWVVPGVMVGGGDGRVLAGTRGKGPGTGIGTVTLHWPLYYCTGPVTLHGPLYYCTGTTALLYRDHCFTVPATVPATVLHCTLYWLLYCTVHCTGHCTVTLYRPLCYIPADTLPWLPPLGLALGGYRGQRNHSGNVCVLVPQNKRRIIQE